MEEQITNTKRQSSHHDTTIQSPSFPLSVKGMRLIHAWCNVTYLPTRSLIHEPPPMILEGKPTRGKNYEQNQFYIILYTVVYIIFL